MTPLDKFASIEVRREDEFSPLKNARGTGEDDPDTSRDDIMAQGQRWVEAAGGIVVTEGDAKGVEVSPLISYVCYIPLLLIASTNSPRLVRTWNSLRDGRLRPLLFWSGKSRVDVTIDINLHIGKELNSLGMDLHLQLGQNVGGRISWTDEHCTQCTGHDMEADISLTARVVYAGVYSK
ncbi:unnamed protein product [Penicillium salamii]|uniref:Uncharacterized protein n=1 Tax=Penicillium salamii TaxID=1612424 RepID=A0A9W4IJH9_9EURO|nr:unnamed protein product [Penicillium salamii]